MWLMLQHKHADDYVVATGESHSVRELCELAFSYLELDYRDYVFEAESDYRPNERFSLVGSAAKLRHELKWEPETSFKEMIHMMVDADLRSLSENNQ